MGYMRYLFCLSSLAIIICLEKKRYWTHSGLWGAKLVYCIRVESKEIQLYSNIYKMLIDLLNSQYNYVYECSTCHRSSNSNTNYYMMLTNTKYCTGPGSNYNCWPITDLYNKAIECLKFYTCSVELLKKQNMYQLVSLKKYYNMISYAFFLSACLCA